MKSVTSVRDTELAGEITHRLASDGRLNVADIVQVRVEGGVALLTGMVGSPEERQVARSIASSVSGVTSVDDRVVIRVPVGGRDSRLQTNALSALARLADPVLNAVGVDVLDGIAHLQGMVPDARRELDAIRTVGAVDGIKRVVSDLYVGEVRPGDTTQIIADDATLRGRVAAAIAETGIVIFNDRTTVKHEIAHLRGHVFSRHDVETAERVALSVGGIQSVKNELVPEEERPSQSRDEELAARVLAELGRDRKVSATYVKPICFGGDVYLQGQVDALDMTLAAVEAAQRVRGVKRVFDNLVVVDRFSLRSDDKGTQSERRFRRRR
jgi:osmotically-inducible protein OsmY